MTPIKFWECIACGGEYETEDQAIHCSCHGAVQRYRCPFCREYWFFEREAIECINTHQPERREPVTVPTSDELEAAGQARLLP